MHLCWDIFMWRLGYTFLFGCGCFENIKRAVKPSLFAYLFIILRRSCYTQFYVIQIHLMRRKTMLSSTHYIVNFLWLQLFGECLESTYCLHMLLWTNYITQYHFIQIHLMRQYIKYNVHFFWSWLFSQMLRAASKPPFTNSVSRRQPFSAQGVVSF